MQSSQYYTYAELTIDRNVKVAIKRDRLLLSFILETYIAPLQETTQRRSQPSHGQRRSTSERCKIWKGGPSEGTAAQREDHSMLMDPPPKRPFAA